MSDTPRRRRRLSAIFMADVAGFSSMMGRDEERTVELVLEFHERVREGIERHGGRVVGTAGDSVFGDFDSIVEAMQLATELQAELHTRNASVAEEERLTARIGLHLGDVVVEEFNVFGDGVNIAARLEEMADPGGILVSEAVYQQVKQHTDVPFEDVGLTQLKNIDQPIKLYRVSPEAFGGQSARPSVAGAPRSETDEWEAKLATSRDEARERYRDVARERAAEAMREAVADRVERGDRRTRRHRRRRHRPDPVVAVFAPGTLVLVTIGVLGIVARSSGWSGNGIYPWLGSAVLGLALGMLVADLSGLHGMRKVLLGLGLAVGGFSLGGVIWRVLSLIAGIAVLGAGIRDVRTGR